jgi:Subtilase family
MPGANRLEGFGSLANRVPAAVPILIFTVATGCLPSKPVSSASPPQQTTPGFKIPTEPVAIPFQNLPSITPLDAEVDDYVNIRPMKAVAKVSGKGLAVAVVDSGINPAHVSFQGQVLAGYNFTGEGKPEDTTDSYGHGSHLAGVVAARRLSRADQPSGEPLPPGIAHEAKIIPLKVFSGKNKPQPLSRINDALRWVLNYNTTTTKTTGVLIGAVNISLGFDNLKQPSELEKRDYFAQLKSDLDTYNDLVRKLFDQHVAIVTAAGNEYVDWNCEEGMVMPAICKETISVGAIYDRTYNYLEDSNKPMTYVGGAYANKGIQGRCTPFTQRLGEIVGKDYHTDIFAPGSEVVSMGKFDSTNPAFSRAGTSILNGTSQAAPIVAGVVLLLQEYYMRLTEKLHPENPLPSVDLIVDCLRLGGSEFKDEKAQADSDVDNAKSCGEVFYRLDALKAFRTLEARYNADLDRINADISAGRAAPMNVLDIPLKK